jgi:hypothetical protein
MYVLLVCAVLRCVRTMCDTKPHTCVAFFTVLRCLLVLSYVVCLRCPTYVCTVLRCLLVLFVLSYICLYRPTLLACADLHCLFVLSCVVYLQCVTQELEGWSRMHP